ncbi:SUMO ligase siz1 [Actinomortierella ambigua]|nr:SUMO ligase siz1 [Actinomortierella ambigua]
MEDLQTIRGRVLPLFKLNDLKALIKTINERVKPAPGLKISGNKKELNDRIYELLSKYNEIGNQDTIQLIRSCINSVRGNQVSFSGSGPSISSMQPRVATPATTTVPTARPTSAMAGGSSATINPGLITRPNSTASAMVSGHHHRSQQQHDGGSSMMGMNMVSSSSSSLYGQSVRMFKPSPFYKEVETLCPPRLCTEAKERTMNVILQFTTTPTLAARLKADPELQVMIFCGWADTPPGQQILMEFPSVCEVKVNQRNLEANLRGMKNKPGTVAPGNITRLCRLEPTGFNRIDFVYVNTTKLGFVRINIPCRSSYCHHLQCFDGYTFFHLNEQTPTWTCPVCSRNMLSWEEIVVDGYFTDILQNTPSSLESVTVQPDGKWEIPSSGKVAVVAETRKATPAPEAKKKVPHDVFVLDDDDDEGEDDGRGGRSGDDNDVEEVDGRRSSTSRDRRSAETPDHQPQAAQEPKQPEIEVIDLISDSEDEDGDAVMQAASLTLQEMANARPNSAAAVKAETVEPSSVATSRSGSTSAPTSTSTASRGTEAAPLISNVAVPTRLPMTADVGAAVATAAAAAAATTIATPATMTESPGRGSSERSPQSTTSSATTSEGHSRAGSAANGWDHGEQENFMHQLIGTNRRKRQYEVDNEMQNMTTEARQRISRMELHSRASSERGSSSAVQSPDAPGRSTSSPSPATGGGGGANDDPNSTRHVHQDRISGLIYDNLSAAAAAAAVVVSSPSTSSPEAMAAPTSTPGVYPHTSYSSQNQQNHYRARPPTSQHHHHQQQQQQQHAGYPASSHTQSRSVAPPADYYSGYSRAPSTEHLRSSSSSAPVPSNSVSPPLHSSSSSSSTSMSVTGWSSGGGSGSGGGGSGSGSSNMWRGGQDHPGSTSTWPSDVASSRPTSSSNGMYASTPASAVAGTAINPYAPRLSTLEELGRAAGILGYSSSSSPSSASSSSNVTSHPQHGYQRQHQSMGYASSPASSTGGGGGGGGGGRRGYDHRDVSQTSPYAHRGGSSGGYSHGRSHSSSSHGYPGQQQQQQQQQQHGAQRRENGVMMVDSRSPSASQRSGYNGSGGDEDGYPHPQHHHRHHQHHHHQHHPHHHQHHSTGPNNEMQQRQMADDLEEEEEVVEQGYGKPIFVPGVRGARAR